MMLKYVPKDGVDTPLVLITGSDPLALEALRAAALDLTGEGELEIAAEKLPGFSSADGCRLVMTNATERPGVQQLEGGTFRWVQDRAGWAQVAELVDPFLRPDTAGTFQFLESGAIDVVLSTDGSW